MPAAKKAEAFAELQRKLAADDDDDDSPCQQFCSQYKTESRLGVTKRTPVKKPKVRTEVLRLLPAKITEEEEEDVMQMVCSKYNPNILKERIEKRAITRLSSALRASRIPSSQTRMNVGRQALTPGRECVGVGERV